MPMALGTVVVPVWFPFLEQLTHGHPQEEGGGQTAGEKGRVGWLGSDSRQREGARRVSQSGGNSLCQGPEAGMARGWNRGCNGMVGDAKRYHCSPAPVGLCGPS